MWARKSGGNRPSEPTTPLPSPQYGKAEASEISDTFCWLNFPDFSSWATDMIECNFLIFNLGPRDMIDLNFLIFHQGPRVTENHKILVNKGTTYLTRLRFSVLRAREGRCGFRGILPISEPTLICGLGRIRMSIVPTTVWVHFLFESQNMLCESERAEDPGGKMTEVKSAFQKRHKRH